MQRIVDRTVTVTIPAGDDQNQEPPFAIPFFSKDISIDGPAGTYRFLATIGRGGAARATAAKTAMTSATGKPCPSTTAAEAEAVPSSKG